MHTQEWIAITVASIVVMIILIKRYQESPVTLSTTLDLVSYALCFLYIFHLSSIVCSLALSVKRKHLPEERCRHQHSEGQQWPVNAQSSTIWWHFAVSFREPDEPHQLHFDLREAALRQGLQHYQLQHPVRPAPSAGWTDETVWHSNQAWHGWYFSKGCSTWWPAHTSSEQNIDSWTQFSDKLGFSSLYSKQLSALCLSHGLCIVCFK